MAVKRIWFFNAPSAGIDILDRSQVGIFYPFNVTFPFGLIPKTGLRSYLRRYLNDVIVADPIVALTLPTPVTVNNSVGGAWEVAKSSLRTYLRRYLNDI